MPLNKAGKPHCVNHENIAMISDKDTINVLTTATVRDDDISFDASKGALVKVFACPVCGYIELYWDKELSRRVLERRKQAPKVAEPASAVADPAHKAAEAM
jgi:hypothetical protein